MKAQNNFTTMAIPSTEEASAHSVILKNDSHSLKSGLTPPLKSNTFIKNEGLTDLNWQ